MDIVATYQFSKDDSCHKLGLKHPVYTVLEKLKQLAPGQGIEVITDDFDLALTMEIIAKEANYGVIRESRGGLARVVIYRLQ